MSDSQNKQADEGLVRAIGVPALGLNIMNMVIGAGIFVLPGVVAAQLGPAAIVAYVLCTVTVALVFLCFAEVGSRTTRSGGAYAYVEDAFGPFAGFIASTLLWFGWSVLANAALAVALVEALATAIPELKDGAPRTAFLLALFGFLAVVNVRGVESGVRLYVVSTIAKLAPLLLLGVVGLFFIEPANLRIVQWPSAAQLGATTLVLFFAFAGAESALNAGGEIRNPARSIPRALLLGLSGIFLLYVLLQMVAQGTLGAALASNTEAPLVAAATVVFGDWGAKLLLAGLAISIFGCISGDLLNTPRVVFASARDGLLPSFLTRVHTRHRTPHVAIMLYAAICCAFALSGSFRELAVVASGSILLIYLGVSLAVLRLRVRDGAAGPDAFRIPGGPTVPVLSALVIVWLLAQMTADEAIGLAVLVAAACAIYGVRAAQQHWQVRTS